MATLPRIAILYHAECSDGFGAAYAAWKKFGARALYIPVPPNNAVLPALAQGKEVYTLDYSFPPAIIPAVLKKVESLTIIDHHISNKEAVLLATEHVFDLKHSGAMLTWSHFHPGKAIPRLLRHIEDSDLWKFVLPYTRELQAVISLLPQDFHVWKKLERDVESSTHRKILVRDGALLLKQKAVQVERALQNAEDVMFAGYKCRMVNSAVHASEIGNALCKAGSPIGIIWSRRGKSVIVSLRSLGDVDVSQIAMKYGGGGHRAAAGFSWEQKYFLRFRRQKR
ncbi:MAG: hypothetical protein A3C84_03690 [Candidatus Ryanbacteria bacterium RIFCSPHIGHO2_02_FULL_48_12]|uniref:DHHA1 domain-containing protein n=1 Tax=Candidatus Ryanbacteria bacterium RIFCSPHIGHO2_01_FULL_48_27 TaxID=1802115 RepID=A0A1G2G704_9BACT|nr:MAG: hypothetical protein A2756_03060 [Candidatus Ryanbacteria bacterium RIFCSPHIGHO2_01_FULL_48_27]OGZ49443.1 MAG: hypothetical protein A3C84_03690 [Candidatus Ryanbacteria bacterium RIFCSPHIGHO2_02_FULL_48_12]